MKNTRNKVSDRSKKIGSRNKVTPVSTPRDERKAPQTHSGRVHRTPDGTIEENSEEAAP